MSDWYICGDEGVRGPVFPAGAGVNNLALDGASVLGSSNTSSTTASAGLTTALTNNIILAFVANNRTAAQGSGTTALSVSGSTLGAFTNRSQFSFQIPASDFIDIEVWWKLAAGTLTGEVVTVTWNAAIDNSTIIVQAVNGANTSNPWSSIPAVTLDTNTGGTGGAPPTITGFSTATANTMLIGFAASSSAWAILAGGAFTLIGDKNEQGGTTRCHSGSEQLIVSAIQGGVTVPFSNNTDFWIMSADALVSS